MARFRAEMDDGSTRHLDADRLVIDDVVRLERRHGDSWITWVSMDPSEVTSVSRRHTELNGSWSWVRVYPATRTQQQLAEHWHLAFDPKADAAFMVG